MIRVFIQNEAGSNQKHLHDEKTLAHKRMVIVSQAYPFPYGFVLDTTSEDGDNVDCFVITDRPLKTGTIVRCEPVGLLEQIEDGEADHNLLALLPDETLARISHGKSQKGDFSRFLDAGLGQSRS